jgi:hypothetical protein
MSQFAYNGVTLNLLRTLSFEMGYEKDPSGTDALWPVYTVRVQGIPITDGGSLVNPSAATIAEIKHLLQTPRKTLSYTVAGETLLSVTNPPDAGMGPEPLPAVVRQMTSSAIFVECGYKVRLRDCATGNPDPVVSLRWEQTEAFDENWYARLSTTGRLIVRSDLRQNADSFRPLVVPLIPTNYRRISSTYTMNRAGTELDFAFVDKQEYLLPPAPARKASGRAMVQVQKGGKRFGQVDVHLESGPGVNRSDLMILAVRIAYAKLAAEGIEDLNLLEGKFAESLWENVVDVSLSAMLQMMPTSTIGSIARNFAAGVVGGGPNVPAPMRSAGQMHGYTPSVVPQQPDVRSSSVPGLLAAMFRDPCAAAAAGTSTGSSGTGQVTMESGGAAKPPRTGLLKTVRGITSPGGATVITGGSGPYSGEFRLNSAEELSPAIPGGITDTAPYDHYEIENEYTEDAGVRQLPGTGSGASAAHSAFVTVHGGMMQLVCTFACKRQGKPPILPQKEPADSNYVYLGSSLTPAGLEIGADGVSPVYTVSGVYRYGVVDPDTVTYYAPFPPFLADRLASQTDDVAGWVGQGVLWKFRGRGDQQIQGNPANNNAAPQMGAGFAGGGDFGGGGGGGGGGGLNPRPPVNG